MAMTSRRHPASGNLNLEREDERWGIEAARSREAAQHAAATQTPPALGPAPSGRADLHMRAPGPLPTAKAVKPAP